MGFFLWDSSLYLWLVVTKPLRNTGHIFGVSENAGVATKMDEPKVSNNDKMEISWEYFFGDMTNLIWCLGVSEHRVYRGYPLK